MQANKQDQDSKANENIQADTAWTNQNVDQDRLEHLTKENKVVTILYNLVAALNTHLNLKDVIQTLYKECGRLIDNNNFAIVLYDDSTDTLDFALVVAQGQSVRPFLIKLADTQGLTRQVVMSQMPLLIRDIFETDQTDETCQINLDQPVRAWLGVPILKPGLVDERAQGVLVTWRYEPDTLTDYELCLLSTISAHAAIAIGNARQFETSQRQNRELAAENTLLKERVQAERDRLIEAREQARTELAQDLHDGPTQLISAVKMRLDLCKMVLEKNPSRLTGEIKAVQELTEQAVHEMRTLLFELRPLILEAQGLQAALHTLLEHRQKYISGNTRLRLNIETTHASGQIARQDEKMEAALFAIVQETVNNGIKHAQANNITIYLTETETAIEVVIIDDGKGFDVDQVMEDYERRGSFGMVNIRERTTSIGGNLTLKSEPGQGTCITVYVPKPK